MKNIHKKFPGVYALKNADLRVEKGEVHALLGENGAGKSTLIKVLGGIYQPDEGEIYIDGQKVRMNNVRDAQANGISIIHQELLLVPQMTVADNMFLDAAPQKYGYINRKQSKRDAQKALDAMGVQIDAGALVATLSVAQQQIVEIVKAVRLQSKIIVMDEPTSSLSDTEIQMLFEIVENLKQNGTAIIFISHKLEELFAITDRITIMRDGEVVKTVETKKTGNEELIALMVGRALDNYYVRDDFPKGEIILKVENLNQAGVLRNVSFELRKGEILGFAGLVGAGRTELMNAIFGITQMDSGNIYLEGKRVHIKNPLSAMRAGIALVPEDRKLQGLILKNSVGFNMTITILREFMKGICVNKKKEYELMDKYQQLLRIKTPSYEQKAGNLSGGNQQKIVISKWLAVNPSVLILDEPTRGIDVGAKAEIYAIMNNLTRNGMSIIMISSEMPEVMGMSDRICVMSEGRLTGIVDKHEFSQERILSYALEGKKDEK
ncbi:sugar ABC transporter ATP-binding protein [Bariatricus massiliensis]|uniref:Sugar ABC transporter ATP-binding protein n=1 Tax=Bariatricus massiliensis TaxID=1745713 RepID=A0ABS8DK48_9FIRM|nr:sugar ABC transporter ATP-binding protein [Bariatricus massiliensis]MCB7305582.1 sugar ABC transporter ATP-binding protein [Bariatricus massiliensis]MCB7376136.1 sugar ABC transporter ATP-binding protein [Bariatricus massiliensis]MCB7388750.1 sugar ABC transporter ATP-binding protein [Bariatricus massiliensis]MCB7412923.1 sugar ABC transporter ATP-binding protein [Bariatricus massiliensis]MCQ5253229.1 sugar ABC transporter ATP-binding protein [Bariatricus massiliensis]